MRTFRTNRGPFSERPHFSDAEVDDLCVDELGKVGLLPAEPSPVRIDRFIEKRFGAPHSYAQLPDGVLGLTRFGPSGVEEVLVAESLEDGTTSSERRVRSTLAHEAGHGLMHAYLFALEHAKKPLFGDWTEARLPKVLCRDGQADWWEYQANMAIGGLLMPKHLVKAAVKPLLVPDGSLGALALPDESRERAARDLAETFDVNPAVARLRLGALFPPKSGGQMSL
jgi:hypothetical protein